MFSVGHHQCDELFQIYEFAGYKLGINHVADLPWEFSEQMRSGIEPFLVYITTKFFHLFAITNPFHIALVLRLFISLLSFWAMYALILRLEKQLTSERAKLWLWAGSFLFWCIPYFHARLSSENVSATVFIFGLNQVLSFVVESNKRNRLFWAGLFFALAFVCRFQIGFMVAGALAWLIFIYKTRFSDLAFVVAGVMMGLGIGLVADKWMYGDWVLTWWNYLDQNLFQSKATAFGVMPFYYFITEGFVQMIPPFSLIIMVCMVGFWLRFGRHLITWISLPFILLHFFVGHKELRFLFPALNFIPLMAVFFVSSFSGDQTWLRLFKHKAFVSTSIYVNFLLLLFMSLKPADEGTDLKRKIYTNIEGNSPLIIYTGSDPYNLQGGLNYFKNPYVKTLSIDSLGDMGENDRIYLFAGDDLEKRLLPWNGTYKLRVVFSAYPAWLTQNFNFNGWVERAGNYTMYEIGPKENGEQ